MLKHYFIILIFFSLKLNSAYKINQKDKEYITKFNILRNLDFTSDAEKVCNRGSDDLIKYFQTGDINYIKLLEYNENKEPSEIVISLINILSSEGKSEENNSKYLNHLLPFLLFLILGILCIPAWIIFCSCAFCNCKCYDCCKATKCRTPFFIIVTIINVIFAADSIIGFIKLNPIFEGLANTECSIVRFISEILDGETKNNLPKWGGVFEIIDIFDRTITEIEKMSRDGSLSSTQAQLNAYDSAVNQFISDLSTACSDISGEGSYKYNNDNSYILDIANNFGSHESGNTFSSGSYADKWVQELEISEDVKEYYNELGNIIRSNVNDVMISAEEVLEDIGIGIKQLEDNLGKKILEYSEKINDIGNIILKLIFSFLFIISIFMEFFIVLLLLSASRQCNCQCCESCMKSLVHIFWNILSILAILMFLVGGIILSISTISKDILEAISYILSSRNLLAPSPRIFDDSGPYLDICINDDGDIIEELGLNSGFNNIDLWRKATNKLDKSIEKITTKTSGTITDVVYEEIMSDLNKRVNNEINFGFVKQDSSERLYISPLTSQLTQELYSCNINDTWSLSCSSEFPYLEQDSCSSPINTNKCIDVKSCYNDYNSRYPASTCANADNKINGIQEIYRVINYANSEDNADLNSIKNQASKMKTSYETYLRSVKDALNNYTAKFRPFSVLYDNLLGDGSLFSLINCAFIGKNVKVLLYYLNDTLNKGFSVMGILFVIDGFLMLCLIAFSILFLAIIDQLDIIRDKEDQIKIKRYLNQDVKEGEIYSDT